MYVIHYFPVVLEGPILLKMYIMSQSLLCYLRIDTLSPSASTFSSGSHSSIAIGWFKNPVGEEEDDESDMIVEGIAGAHSAEHRTHKTDEEDMVIPKVSYAEALQALERFYSLENITHSTVIPHPLIIRCWPNRSGFLANGLDLVNRLTHWPMG